MPARALRRQQRDLTRRDLGLGAATALALGALRPGAARAADAVDRSDTLIIEACARRHHLQELQQHESLRGRQRPAQSHRLHPRTIILLVQPHRLAHPLAGHRLQL